jgi:hypothetical protein
VADRDAELSAPEAFVLLSLPRYDAAKVLKTGFIGLLAQGVLRLETEDRPGLIRTRHIPHLKVAENAPQTLPPIAASLVQVVRNAAPDGLMKAIVAQSRREFRRTLLGFAQNRVIPSLVGRGLAEERAKKLLGFIPTRVFARTAAGETEKIRLENAMRNAKTIPQYLDSDPAKVAALVLAAGSAILLVDELRPFYDRLSRALSPRDGAGGGFTDGGGLSDGGAGFTSFDFGHVDFSSFDSGAFTSFDAGFSDAGGDGGGGDSGGSSGC